MPGRAGIPVLEADRGRRRGRRRGPGHPSREGGDRGRDRALVGGSGHRGAGRRPAARAGGGPPSRRACTPWPAGWRGCAARRNRFVRAVGRISLVPRPRAAHHRRGASRVCSPASRGWPRCSRSPRAPDELVATVRAAVRVADSAVLRDTALGRDALAHSLRDEARKDAPALAAAGRGAAPARRGPTGGHAAGRSRGRSRPAPAGPPGDGGAASLPGRDHAGAGLQQGTPASC
jgi:hypothetical protein